MKKLFIFVSFTPEEIELVSERMKKHPGLQEYLGFLGKIEFNKEECLNSISGTVNYFLTGDKEKIYFGCDEKDLAELLGRINTQNCEIIKITGEDFRKNTDI